MLVWVLLLQIKEFMCLVVINYIGGNTDEILYLNQLGNDTTDISGLIINITKYGNAC